MSTGIRSSAVAAAAAVALVLTGCAVEKTSNPLSPSVAGPIPGVDITTPAMVQPPNHARIAADQQPVTLTIGNASSSGQRPLSYRFEIASDVEFTNVVLSRDSVQAGTNGQTSHKLSDPLSADRVYYWRARAEDGANTGPYSVAAQFTIFTPLSLGAPVPLNPINNAVAASLKPVVTWQNAPRTGPQAAIIYTIEASDSSAFTNSVTALLEEQPGAQTSYQVPQDLPSERQVFWRVRASASNPLTVGPWSATAVFRTPAPPAPAPSPSPAPGGGGGGGGSAPSPDDQLDLRTVTILKGPAGVVNWSVGSRITRTSQGNGELCIWHDQLGRWPSGIFMGDPNTLVEGNQWVFANINGKWYGGAADWYRPGQACKEVTANSIGRDSFDQEPLRSWVPRPGETFGVMSSTPARLWPDMRTLDVRTNIVLMRWQ